MVRIAFLLQPSGADIRPPNVSPVTGEVIGRLRAMAAEVDLIVPEAEPLDLMALRPRHDLYVLESQTALALAWAGALTTVGATVLNTYAASVLARDKIASTPMLAAAGVPVPSSWATVRGAALGDLLERQALWLKSRATRDGGGVRRVTTPADLHAVRDVSDPHRLPLPLFAQGDVPSPGFDLKIYAVGEAMWALARPFPARAGSERRGTPVALEPELAAAAALCGRVLGLEVYGVDIIASRDRFAVIDVEAFPGYKGVAAAPSRLAQYIHQHAQRAYAAGTA